MVPGKIHRKSGLFIKYRIKGEYVLIVLLFILYAS